MVQHLTDNDGRTILDDFGLPIEDKTGWQAGQALQEEAWTNGGRTGSFVRYLGNPADPQCLIETRSKDGAYGNSPLDRWTAQVTPGAWEPTKGMVTVKNSPRGFPEASSLANRLVDGSALYRIVDRPGVQPVTGHRLGYTVAKSIGKPGVRVEHNLETGEVAITVSRIEKTIYRPER